MDLLDVFVPRNSTISPASFAGEYVFQHDGWPGVLTLRISSGRNVRGEYRDSRLNQTFTVTGKIDTTLRHRLEMVVHEFNWLDEQRFVGYLFTHGTQAIAGTTWWKESPFGFVAWKAAEVPPSATFQTGDAEPADFAGRYDMLHDGWAAVVELDHTEGRRLTGVYRNPGLDRELRLEAEVDADVPHACTMRFTGDLRLGAVQANGYLFSRPKNAIAGEIRYRDMPTGFIMTRSL